MTANVKFHMGGTQDLGLSKDVLDRIRGYLSPGLRTLETGAGRSTVLFAESGCNHTAITPSSGEVTGITSYCEAEGVSLDTVTFVVEGSERALPRLTSQFDFVLIDGGHGFPLPFIDWFYAARLLSVGGVIAIDDIQISVVKALCDFLRRDPAWEFLECIDFKTDIFRLVQPFSYTEWHNQPSVVRSTRGNLAEQQLRRLAARIRRGALQEIVASIARRVSLAKEHQ